MILRLRALRLRAKVVGKDYYKDVLSFAKNITKTTYELSKENFDFLRKKYKTSKKGQTKFNKGGCGGCQKRKSVLSQKRRKAK